MQENGLPDMAGNIGLSVYTDINLAEFDAVKTDFRSDFFTVLLVQKGIFKGYINRQELTLDTDCLMVIAPKMIKRMVSAEKDCVVSAMSFTMDLVAEIGIPPGKWELYDYFTTKYSPLWHLNKEDAQLVYQHFKQLVFRCEQLVKKAPFAKELLHHTFFLLLYELSAMGTRYLEQKGQTTVSRKENLVMNFTSLVQSQFREHRRLQFYAEQLYVTPKYLTETVKELTGKNAGEVIDDFVTLEAKLLLDDPRLSISQIAEILHFSDQSFFGKFFKRHTGFSPREFRNLHQ